MVGIESLFAQVTEVKVRIPDKLVSINPMIYGQMLENVNDQVIYGGVANEKGEVRRHLIPLLQELKIPVMRWPGGTAVFEYHWRYGIGPKEKRPSHPLETWKGVENYQFGTDEFLQWCEEVGTEPYINFNMSLHPEHLGTLENALEWIEYVNGDENTALGSLRAKHGRREPYGVKFWCIGNENYLNNRVARVQEKEAEYAERLKTWASTIRKRHADLQLLGVGHTTQWNETVLKESGEWIDYLTQHFYVGTRLKDGEIQDPLATLFAPAEMEAHLVMLGEQLKEANVKLGRVDRPIRLSVDEWNNRHSRHDGKGYKFSRQSPRRAFDVAVVGGMLNAFIRQSEHVGMANYIFPVNGHGLIRTVGEEGAFRTTIYHVFQQYREQMVGKRIEVEVEGASLDMSGIKLLIAGDSKHEEISLEGRKLPYVDSAAVLSDAGSIHVSLINRSPDSVQQVRIEVPDGYVGASVWKLSHEDIHAINDAEHSETVMPSVQKVSGEDKGVSMEIAPCGLVIVTFVRAEA